MEPVFRALADSNRRALLDRLFERDGQTLFDLQGALPAMTRFGVMKHLRVLEDAGLVTTRRHGRQKLHYLNPVPIRVVLDRWISKYAGPWVEAMTDLKHTLEGAITMSGAKHVYQIYIRTSPERLWAAITQSEFTEAYFGGAIEIDAWKPGASYKYRRPVAARGPNDDGTMHYGALIEVDPPRRLVQTFQHDFNEAHGGGPDDVSQVTWEIEPVGDLCKLTLVHEYKAESQSFHSSGQGWPMILSGLKSLLETGEALTFPA